MLRLVNVCKTYNGRRVLHDLSLVLPPGAALLVAGRNGAGKSTLLRLMAGLEHPDSGNVVCNAAPGAIGYLGHDTLIYPNLTALENLTFWARLHRKEASETTLLDALASVDLLHYADDMAGAFSRGMAQRLSLARLLLLSPTLALLDEPLTGLDAASAANMRDAFARLKHSGTALVWVTHDPVRDAAYADAALLLQEKHGYALHAKDEFAGIAWEAASPC